jgi:hypothetical protein
MPRPQRVDEAGGFDLALNRGHGRSQIFWTDDDDSAFERILAAGPAENDVSVFSFLLMPNYSHRVLRPIGNGHAVTPYAGTVWFIINRPGIGRELACWRALNPCS